MANFRHVTDDLSVSPQINLADVAEAARLGFKTLINNRPDGEDPAQTPSADIEAAAKAAGLAYFFIPVRGMPTPDQVEATRDTLDQAEKPVLAFCRSGNRSIVTWSICQALAGADRGELLELGRQAGYDLSSVLGG